MLGILKKQIMAGGEITSQQTSPTRIVVKEIKKPKKMTIWNHYVREMSKRHPGIPASELHNTADAKREYIAWKRRNEAGTLTEGDVPSYRKPKKIKKPSVHNNWIAHVKKYAKDHNVSYSQALKRAGATYKKVDKKRSSTGKKRPSAAVDGTPGSQSTGKKKKSRPLPDESPEASAAEQSVLPEMKKKKKKKPSNKKKMSAWNIFLQKFMKEHPELGPMEAAHAASPIYRAQKDSLPLPEQKTVAKDEIDPEDPEDFTVVHPMPEFNEVPWDQTKPFDLPEFMTEPGIVYPHGTEDLDFDE